MTGTKIVIAVSRNRLQIDDYYGTLNLICTKQYLTLTDLVNNCR